MLLRSSISILLVMVPSVVAQAPANSGRQAAITGDRIRGVLREMALDFTEDSSGLSIPFEGHGVRLRYRADGLNLSVCYAAGFDLMKANQWNRQHFSTGIGAIENDCIPLRADASFGGGASDLMIRDFVRRFCTAVVVWDRFLNTAEARTASPIGPMAWTQLGPFAKAAAQPVAMEPAGGLLKIHSNVSLKYDAERWRPVGSDADGQFAFEHGSGGRALVLVESTPVPLDSIEDIALANAQAADPQARIVFRNRPWVQGAASWFLRIEATVNAVPMVYWGHYYAGDGGSVQIVTYAEKNRWREYEQRFTEFLNGLTVSK